MLTLNDGRKELYQWDTGRIATIDIDCDVVHFSNLKYGDSLAVEVKEGEVAIPNKLLMSGAQIYCWAFAKDDSGAYTKQEQTLPVIKRAKPSDYVYTETQIISIQTAVESALEEAKESGDFKGDPGEPGANGQPGADGTTPHIGENGNWFIGDTDTGVPARGEGGGILAETDPTVFVWAKSHLPFTVAQLSAMASGAGFVVNPTNFADGKTYFRYHAGANSFTWTNPNPQRGAVTITVLAWSQYGDKTAANAFSALNIVYGDGTTGRLSLVNGQTVTMTTDANKVLTEIRGNYDHENWVLLDMDVLTIAADYPAPTGTVKSVNGNLPDEDGNVQIPIPEGGKQEVHIGSEEPEGSESIWIDPDEEDDSGYVWSVNGKTGAVQLKASDVGARPDNWMPTADEVGAASKEELGQVSEAIAELGGALTEPAEDDIPKVFFKGTAPQTKAEDELPLEMEYVSKTLRFHDYVTLKVQGDSSAGYPKKNFNLKMFSDADRTKKDKRVFRDWSKTHKYCLKANWIDHTHARNVVGGRLWGQVVRSRADYESYPVEYRESANCGAVNGFPVKVYLNGVYQGLYTWNIRKDESMFNMDDETGTHAALIADTANTVTAWRALPNIDGSDWTDELNDTVPDAVKTGFQAVYAFVMNSTDDEFKENIEQYFYLSSLIDYYIYIYCILMIGGLAKSQTQLTYDAEKYLANIYDMDTTWALHWAGSSFYDVETPCPSGYAADGGTNLLYERLVALFPDRIKARYAELRNSVLSNANIINEFERFMDVIPNDLYTEDFANTTAGGAFTEIPSKTTNTLQKLREIIVQRMAYCDEEIPKIGSGNSEEPGEGDEPGEDNTEQTTTVAWELGAIGASGEENEHSARIRTADYLPDKAVSVNASTGYKIMLVSYDKYGNINPAGAYYKPDTGTFGADGNYTDGTISVSDAVTAAGTYNKFRVVAKRTDGANMSTSEGENITITLGDGDADDDTGGDTTSTTWESGGLENTGTENTNAARIRTVDYLPDNVTGLSVNPGYAYILVCYNSAGEIYESNHGYYQPSQNALTYNGEYSSDAISFADIADALGEYNKIRVLLKRTDGAPMQIAEGENVIFTTA